MVSTFASRRKKRNDRKKRKVAGPGLITDVRLHRVITNRGCECCDRSRHDHKTFHMESYDLI